MDPYPEKKTRSLVRMIGYIVLQFLMLQYNQKVLSIFIEQAQKKGQIFKAILYIIQNFFWSWPIKTQGRLNHGLLRTWLDGT